MNAAREFVALSHMALDGLRVLWPVSALLVGSVAAALMGSIRRRALTWRNLQWSLTPVVVPLALTTWGTVFRDTGYGGDGRWTWEARALIVLWVAQLPVSAVAVWRAVPARLFAVTVSALIAYWSYWACLVAFMSVTNDWL